jgi:cation diffusion facilitator family transporter
MTQGNHDHVFDQDQRRPGELRTLIVIALTAATMVLEIAAGLVFGSMALLADGLHMASHASALSIAALAYVYARRHARDERFCFGTGKVNALAGFTGAVLLALFALAMAWESISRLLNPVEILFNQAIGVAVIGLIVNGVSVWILDCGDSPSHHHRLEGGGEHEHEHEREDGHEHEREQGGKRELECDGSDRTRQEQHHDHNLRSAYLHVLADALTSVLAIAALLAGKYWGLQWLDPVIGVAGAILVARWSLGLLHSASCVLLDHQGPLAMRQAILRRLTDLEGVTVTDLHLWEVGPGIYGLVVSLTARAPHPPEFYKGALAGLTGLVHITIEVSPQA